MIPLGIRRDKNLLIKPERVVIGLYYQTWRPCFRLAGFIQITPYTAPPPYKRWDKQPYNRFCSIAPEAVVDGKPAFVLPCFVNDEEDLSLQFDCEYDKSINLSKPWVVFFKGNDDWHYALRFERQKERDMMLQFFGEDLGFLDKELIGHN